MRTTLPYLQPTSNFSLTRVSGNDSKRFLQGQLSCNMDHVTTERSVRGALCNLKGRVITNLRVLTDGTDYYLLASAGMDKVICDTLARYKVFFKAELTPVTDDFRCWHICADAVDLENWLPKQATAEAPAIVIPGAPDQVSCLVARQWVIRIAGDLPISMLSDDTSGSLPRYLLLCSSDAHINQTLMGAVNPSQSWKHDVWALADAQAGVVHIRPQLQERFTPQLLDYDLNGEVDFKKGCYTGQEVVARMFYRAEAKKRLASAILQGDETITSLGVSSDEIIDVLPMPDGRQFVILIASTDKERRAAAITLFHN